MSTLEYIIKKYNIDTTKRKEDGFIVIPNTRRDDLVKIFAELGFRDGVEIGVEKGRFSYMLCAGIRKLKKLYGVDPYKAYADYRDYLIEGQIRGFREMAIKNLAGFRFELIEETSMEALKHFGDNSLDFVYIDANHDLKYVVEDIVEWTKKVKIGGIVSGHDYTKARDKFGKYWFHVPFAVKAYVEAYEVDPVFILGERMDRKRDFTRSWFFVKEK